MTNGESKNSPTGHEIMDVSHGKSVKSFSQKNINAYNYIFIDYYRVNDYYWANNLFKDSFFKNSLHSLWVTLKKDGCIFSPFLPSIMRNMIAHYHAITKLFKIEYILEEDIEKSNNYLWRASDILLKEKQFNYLMNCEKTKDMNLGNVTKRQILSTMCNTSTDSEVHAFCDNISQIKSVLFVRLTKYEENHISKELVNIKRQVKGQDLVFMLINQKMRIISIRDRLTVREINNMYKGDKRIFAVNPNLKEKQMSNAGYLLIVKYKKETTFAICFKTSDESSAYIVLKEMND